MLCPGSNDQRREMVSDMTDDQRALRIEQVLEQSRRLLDPDRDAALRLGHTQDGRRIELRADLVERMLGTIESLRRVVGVTGVNDLPARPKREPKAVN
jgi:hypothetical protein